jgi:hypothetical protein
MVTAATCSGGCGMLQKYSNSNSKQNNIRDFCCRFNSKDYENGYSRNLLWRLWHAAKIFKLKQQTK